MASVYLYSFTGGTPAGSKCLGCVKVLYQWFTGSEDRSSCSRGHIVALEFYFYCAASVPCQLRWRGISVTSHQSVWRGLEWTEVKSCPRQSNWRGSSVFTRHCIWHGLGTYELTSMQLFFDSFQRNLFRLTGVHSGTGIIF